MVVTRLLCRQLLGHKWTHDTRFPTHGFRDLPNDGAYCTRCKYVYNKPKSKPTEDVLLSKYGDVYEDV